MPTYLRAVLLSPLLLTSAPAGAVLCQYVATVDQGGETELLHPCVSYDGDKFCEARLVRPGEGSGVYVVICRPDPDPRQGAGPEWATSSPAPGTAGSPSHRSSTRTRSARPGPRPARRR